MSTPHSTPRSVLFLARLTLDYHKDGLLAPEGIDEPNEVTMARRVIELEEQFERLETSLRYIEWVWDGTTDRCPSCGMTEEQGHDGSCRTAAVLYPASTPEVNA